MRNASIRSAASSQKDPDAIVRELTQAWAGMSPTAIAFFTGHTRDGAAISAALRRAFPGTPNVGGARPPRPSRWGRARCGGRARR